MYVKVNILLRKVTGLSSNQLRQTTGSVVLNKPEITTTNINYIKVLSGETIDVAEMNEGEKAIVDAEKAATQAELLVIAQNNSLNNLSSMFEFVIGKIDKYPTTEMISWDKQLKEAQAYQLDPEVAVPLITQIASERTDLGETLDARIAALVDRIILNDTTYTSLSGVVIGRRHMIEKRIKEATSQVELPSTEEMRNELDAVLAAALAVL